MFSIIQRHTLRKRDGFAMAEVVVASTILMVVFLAVLGTFSYARRTASLTENQLACLHIARQVMESLHTLAYTASALDVGAGKTLPGFPSTRGYYTVTVDSAGTTKDITVVIQWTEPTGKSRSVSLTTSLSQSVHR